MSTDIDDVREQGRARRRKSLSAKQVAIIEVIQRSVSSRGYPPSMREIGDAVGLSSLSSVTHQLNQLELAGYLRREPDEHDRRVRRVSVTEEGERVLAVLHHRLVEAFSTAMSTWEDDEVVALARGLDRLREDFRHTVAPPKEAAV